MRILLLLLLFGLTGSAFGQDPVIQLDANIRNDDNGKRLEGVTIEILKDGAPFVKKTTGSNGKAPLIDLPIGHVYTVKIHKPGFVTKVAQIDSRTDFPEDLPLFYKQPFETGLFAEVEDVDFNFLETTPMIEFSFDGHGLLGWDKGKLSAMQKKIAALKSEMEKKKKEQEAAAKAEEKKAADIAAYVKAGDAAMGKEDYETAMSQYKAALDLKADPGVQTKYDDAKKKYDDQVANAASEKAFSEKMAAAKKEFDARNLEPALSLYQEAVKLKPDSKLAKDRIEEIKGMIANAAENEANFKKLVAEGDKAVGAKSYSDAIAKYQEALKIKPKDAPTQQKLDDAKKAQADAEKAEADAAALKGKFDKLVAEADKLFDTKKYEESKAKYEEAQTLIADEPKPPQRIKEIDDILAKLKADADAAAKLEKDYKDAIALADKAFNSKQWDEAKKHYTTASGIKTEEQYPKNQIDLINKELEKEAAAAKNMEEYKKLMADANGYMAGKKYEEAKTAYTAASTLMPDEQEPKDKLKEIEQLLADLAKAAELEKQYKDFMKAGADAQTAKEYVSALDKYQKALGVKPGDASATAKINEIKKLIDDQNKAAEADKLFAEYVAKGEESFNAKDYGKSKINYEQALGIKEDAAVRAKLKEIEKLMEAEAANAELKAKYDAIIKEADDQFTQSKYETALSKYQEAQKVLDTDYVKGRISECQIKLGDAAAAAEKEQKFKDLVAAGDDAFSKEDWDGALAKYKEALSIKPDPTISQKILDANSKLAEHAANAEQEKKYQAKIAEADIAFNNKDWDPAKQLYNDALNIIEKQYPKDQLVEIDKQMEIEAADKIEAAYQKVISKADGLRDSDQLDDAISYYERASGFKPSDPYPKEQIEAIKQLKIDRAKAASDAEELEKQYNAYIKAADESYNAEAWDKALENYKNALALKPAEPHPKSRVDELKVKIGDAAAYALKKAEYDKYIAEADGLFNGGDYLPSIKSYEKALGVLPDEQYPKDQIDRARKLEEDASASLIEKEYQNILNVAEKKFNAKDYKRAIELYERAKDLKPSDPIPQQRIDEINQIMSDMANAAKHKAAYDKLIKEADHFFESTEWVKAKSKYTEAYNLINEKYPESQIALCDKKLAGEEDVLHDKMYNKIIAAADKYFAGTKYNKAKEYYKRAIKMKSGDPHPHERLKEIEKLLNPDSVAQTGGMKNRGQPDRGANPLDIEGMLRDAKEQREWISNQKAQKQREDAEDHLIGMAHLQQVHNSETEDAAEQMELDISGNVWSAEMDRVEAVTLVNDFEDQMNEVYSVWEAEDDDQSELHRQTVENIYLEVENERKDAELDRIEFIGDVEIIKIETSTKESLQARSQEDVVMANKDHVTKMQIEQSDNNLKNDAPRKNSEVYVEDFNIAVINKRSEASWDQEDEVMNTKDLTELLIDERTANRIDDDIPRIEDVEEMKDLIDLNVAVYNHNKDEQSDATQAMRAHAEEMRTDVEINSMNNDIPRQNFEAEVEKREVEIAEQTWDYSNAQYNSNQDAKKAVTDLQIKNTENINMYNDRRVQYEDVVEEFSTDLQTRKEILDDKSEDVTHSTVDHLDQMTTNNTEFSKQEDDKANKNHAETVDAVESIIDHNSDVQNNTDGHLEDNMDYIESLKDINPNEIDEKMKNQLGVEFPEGVTEEVYTNKDEDGLLISYVVRRIVVRNGVGNFYEKIQTAYGGVTYTMNGAGITEYQWQDQTEAADLVRN